MSRKVGSKKLILEFFFQNIGKVLESRQIQEASGGASEWARRVRELRNEEGYQILSHKDRIDLNGVAKAQSCILEEYFQRNAGLGVGKEWIYLSDVWNRSRRY